MRYDVSPLTDDDVYLFNEGSHFRLYDKLGAHPLNVGGKDGVHFGVWAPNAREVFVMGDWNGWNKSNHPLRARGNSGIWEGWVPGLGRGTKYKYHIISHHKGYTVDKADPMARHHETPPRTASIVWDVEYTWEDAEWMRDRARRNAFDAPMSVYEVHLGSWMRVPEEGNRSLNYRELAFRLTDHVKHMGFTHVEFMPIMEHPFYGSWGYQVTGYMAPTSRYGTPQDFMFLVDHMHQQGIGVILDWVPSHFPSDEHGLAYFDGTHLYEHEDPRKGFHPDWQSYIFNYGRNEVRSFLMSSAMLWLDHYHVDGLRVDAVASMLYLDYSRKQGEWIPNIHGGRENLEAIEFLRRFNTDVYQAHGEVQTIAEESTAWPAVSRPTYVGGLGFGMKWDMGWMHDTLKYFSFDPVFRQYHHNDLTFHALYSYTENFMLPLSHDEVVHGKGSMLGKMSGDEWQKFANLRLLYGYMYGTTGKKLLFMGAEIGSYKEWNHDSSLDWHLLQNEPNKGLQRWLSALNHFYRNTPAMYELDFDPEGFRWVDCSDNQNSVLAFLRRAKSGEEVLAVCNFTPVPRMNYRIGVPQGGYWRELLNSDAHEYWGSGMGNMGGAMAQEIAAHGFDHSLALALPPLSVVYFKAD